METPTTPRAATKIQVRDDLRMVRVVAVVLIAALAVVGLAATPADARQARPSDPAAAEAEFVQRLNQVRTQRGLASLVVHPNLVRDARAWSAVMAREDRYFHTSNLGGETARSLPNWRRAGENVGRGWDVKGLHDAFVASPGHYNNMVGDFHYVGIGVVYTQTRTYVTVRFAKVDNPVTPPVSWSVATAQVRRLYLAFFQREPDAGGLNYWVSRVSARLPLQRVADNFVGSSEFRRTYGSLNNRQFVTLVYHNVLNRAPDSGGYNYWTNRLRQGMTRGDLMVEFSESNEFIRKT